MRETLPVALRLMFGHEGGYSAAKTDRGNYLNGKLVGTKYGITGKTLAAHLGKPSVTAERVQAMTLEEATAIYRQSYWTQSGGDVFPKGLDYQAFDFGVNSGPNRAIKNLQQLLQAAGVYTGKIDGWVGEGTLRGVKDYPDGREQLITDYAESRMRFLRGLKDPKTGFPVNGRGWTIRVMGTDPKGQWKPQPGVIGNALKLAAGEFEPIKDAPHDYDGAPEGGDAKAEPKDKNPWLDPGVILPGAGGLLGSLGALFSGTGPIQWALALGIVACIGIGAVYAVRTIGRAQA